MAALAVFTVAGIPTAAHAADATVGTESELVAALGSGPGTVTLRNDITVVAASITVASTVTLDLAGFTLTAQNITLGSGITFTIDDSSSPSTGKLFAMAIPGTVAAGITTMGANLMITGGAVSATGAGWGAGIGNGYGVIGATPGSVTITGGTVTATGGDLAAGIGGGLYHDGTTTTITGGTVTAIGGSGGAGIGGGMWGNGVAVTISGGTVTATGGADGAGIGGGISGGEEAGDGGTVVIGAGAVVTATGGSRASSVGTDFNPLVSSEPALGSLSVAGTLSLGSDLIFPSDGGAIAVTSTGKITGSGTIRGIGPTAGTIANGGTIATTIGDNVTVTGNSFAVYFDSNIPPLAPYLAADPIFVYAPTIAAAGITVPTPTRPGYTFTGWKELSWVDAPTLSSAEVAQGEFSADGSPYYFAQWKTDLTVISLTIVPDDLSLAAGYPPIFTVTGMDASGATADVTGQVVFSTDDPAVAPWEQPPASITWLDAYPSFTTAGTYRVTATLAGSPSVSSTVDVTVVPSILVNPLTLTLEPSTAHPGDTVTLRIAGTDEFGNAQVLEATEGYLTVVSDNPADTVTETVDDATGEVTTTITFAAAGERTITATSEGGEGPTLTGALVVTVTPMPVVTTPTPPSTVTAATLPVTGFEPTPAPLIALFLMLLGCGAILVGRGRRA